MTAMPIDRSPKKYLNDEDIDIVARQNIQLMTELWMVKDRLAVLEKLLVDAGTLKPDALNQHVPGGDFAQTLEHERAAYVERIMALPGDERTLETLKRRSATVRARG